MQSEVVDFFFFVCLFFLFFFSPVTCHFQGLSAAHTIMQNGGSVVVFVKDPFMGGNSTKATSGINGAGTRAQFNKGIPDSPKQFYEDTMKGARELARPELIKVLTNESAPSVHWVSCKKTVYNCLIPLYSLKILLAWTCLSWVAWEDTHTQELTVGRSNFQE